MKSGRIHTHLSNSPRQGDLSEAFGVGFFLRINFAAVTSHNQLNLTSTNHRPNGQL